MDLLLMKNFWHGRMAHTHVMGNVTFAGGWCYPILIANVILRTCRRDSSSSSGVALCHLQISSLSKSKTNGKECGVMWQMSSWMLSLIYTAKLSISARCTVGEMLVSHIRA